jgi:hypothetical protein
MGLGLQNNSRYFGQAAGGSASAASDASGITGFLGKISPYAPLIGLGAQFLGAAMDDTPEQQLELERQKLALDRERMNQENNQFNQTLGQKKYEDERTFGFQGLNQLAANRAEAGAKLRKYNFRNAVLDAAKGAA